VVPAGKRAFPRHSHRTNEEISFVIEGAEELRVGEDTFPIKQGDVIARPPGGPETAHQIFNSSETDLKYLAVSPMISPELAEYPDSGNVGLYHYLPPDAEGNPQRMWFVVKDRQTNMDGYWDGKA